MGTAEQRRPLNAERQLNCLKAFHSKQIAMFEANSTLHLCIFAPEILKSEGTFLCFNLVFSLRSEREQGCTPILFCYFRQWWTNLFHLNSNMHLSYLRLWFSFVLSLSFIDSLNHSFIHLSVLCHWSAAYRGLDGRTSEATAGWASDYSHYSLCLHRALVLCATSPLVSWQSEL